jgi:ATP-dependent DNA helicase PIF1
VWGILDTPKLRNGTRLCVKKLMPNIIQATILTGSAKEEDVFIPRIPLIPSDMPFDFKRLQYPVHLSFAMTINKAQEQSLSVAGVNLLKFFHFILNPKQRRVFQLVSK